jgi:hypothetical protein
VTCPDASATGAGRVALGAGVFGVVLMAGSFGGTRSADRLGRLIPVSAPSTYTSNRKLAIFFQKIW